MYFVVIEREKKIIYIKKKNNTVKYDSFAEHHSVGRFLK